MEMVDIKLSQLTLAQKLNLMEALWDDLARDEENIESPPWHKGILKDREKSLTAGKANISNWEEAKVRIESNVSCR